MCFKSKTSDGAECCYLEFFLQDLMKLLHYLSPMLNKIKAKKYFISSAFKEQTDVKT